MTEISEDAESLVSENHDRTIHQNSGRPNRPSAGAYQQACFALDCNVVTVSDKFSLILFDSLFGPLGQLNIPQRGKATYRDRGFSDETSASECAHDYFS
jgi:hypothetical protein